MKKRGYTFLGLVQLFVAIGAIPAGYLFFSAPDGSRMGMTTEALVGSPFKNYLIPGIFLFSVNGILNLLCSVFSFYKYKYAPVFGIILGAVLIMWVIVQVYSIGLSHFLQPTYLFVGLLEIFISIYLFKSAKAVNKKFIKTF
jgi:hypothetical protein